MIIHDKSDTSKYFEKGLDYVKNMPLKKKLFGSDKNKGDQEEQAISDKIIIIGTTSKDSLDYISNVIIQKQGSGIKLDQMVIVILDYFKDSMIRSKYIKGKLLRGNKTKFSPEYVFVEFNELDKITQIEDEYNQCFSYKNLSRHYKKQLQYISNISNNSVKDSQESPVKGGNDFANSTMV